VNEEGRRAAAEAFGRRVAAERQKRQMTQGDLARLLDVTQQYVSAVENGNENLTLLTMAKLADVFGLDLADMLRS
jgi:transcriptional regulator with XRE-family HTH domain